MNIFVSPLKFSEWITSFLIIGFLKAVVSLIFTSALAFFLYKFEIFIYGFYIIPFFFLLILTGWWVGFFVASIVLRYGTRVQTLAWTTVAVISPFSAVYYPLSTLPNWAQNVGLFIPTTYIFEGAREVIERGELDPKKLIICLILNIFYLALSLIFLKKSFGKILEKGLVKIH
ncbi:ABC transporter permease [Candidatus Roizmanbacteria bacterium]|nr:ABC transporter permease [Candidatus Roizmanbacteria bacterium]